MLLVLNKIGGIVMSAYVRKTLSFLIVLTMVLALVLVPSPIQVKSEAASVPSTLASYIQDGCTLQCWNWSLANIKANLGLIASQGYSAIQISPMQEQKETSVNKPFENWWVVYQPISFKINEKPGNAIGTRDELIDLCAEAHKYDIKVIMDVVSNHMANNGENVLSPLIDPDILNDPSCWHDYSTNSWDYSDRYNITQYCMAGLPDLNTGSDKIQTKVLDLLKDYIDCGVDGFRFDAAKQIETPSDRSEFASDFWPTVINGANQYASSTRGIYLYSYGELLENPDNGGQLPVSAYTQYMSVTESVWSNDVRYRLEDNNASGLQQAYFKDANADKLVLWAESHDTFGDGSSVNSHPYQLFQAWALVASRAYAMSLYFPRANDMLYQEMGQIAKAGWSDANVKAVNKFHNQFIGQSEYLTKDSSGNMYYNERGNSGVMIVNFSGGGRDINIPVYAMADGTYYDQITGNKFTVNGGRLYGTMGDTGVACVYNPTSVSCSHSSHGLDGYCYDCYAYVGHSSGSKCSVCGTASTRTIYFKNSDGWSNVYLYGWHDNNSTVTSSWPGNKMTKVEGTTDIYSIDVPATATNIIFNNNGSVQTANLVPSADNNTYDYASGFWSNYGVVDNTCDYYLFGSINGEDYNDYGYKFVDGELTVTFDSTSYVYILDSNGVEYMTNDWVGEVSSTTLYNVASLTAPNKLMIPGGVEVTLSVTPNADGTLTLSYSTAGCSHTWGTGSVTTAATCDKDGVKTYTCSLCGDTKTEAIPTLGHSWDSGKETTAATCDKDGVKTYTCGTCGDTKTEAIPALSHNYVNGTCSNCGAEESKNTMAIYFQNNWMWSDVCLYYWGSSISACADWPGNAMELYGNDGTYDIYKLEIPADVTGIVINGVKNDGSGERDKTPDITSGWYDGICYYMTWNDGNQAGSESIDKILPCEHSYTSKVTTDASCGKEGVKTFTCANCGDTYTESIPALEHNYVDGTCTNCGEQEKVEVQQPGFEFTGASLLFEDEIFYNFYFMPSNTADVVEYGVITFTTKLADGTHADAVDVIPGAVDNGDGTYTVRTNGIPAKEMGDWLYFRVYAKLSDDSYAYATTYGYRATAYANTVLSGNSDTKTKALMVAMLNYGAAAQEYFGHNTDSLMNAGLTEAQKALVEDYSADMLGGIVAADSSKTAAFPKDSTCYTPNISVSFEGAFAVNYYFTPKHTPDGELTMYYWDAATYNSISEMTRENATSVMTLEKQSDGSYLGAVEGIAAKEVDSTIYVALVYTSGGTEYCSGILAYSLGTYFKSVAGGTSTAQPLGAAVAAYSYYAKQYFAG